MDYDGFGDANFVHEFLYEFTKHPLWKTDGKGANLELFNGKVYDYAPSYIMLPR